MRIAINTLPLLDGKAGAERYTKNLIKYIAKCNSENKYYLFLSSLNKPYYEVEDNQFNNIVLNLNPRIKTTRILGEQLYLPWALKRLGIDLLFSPCNIGPKLTSVPLVITLFDLHWLLFPELFSPIKLFYLRMALKWSVHKAQAVITISQNSKNDILRMYKIPQERVKVIYLGLDPIFKKETGVENLAFLKQRYGIIKKYFLYVGQFHKRKNIMGLLRAFVNLKTESQIDHQLVLVGGDGDGSSEVKQFLNKMGLKDVLVTGCIPDQEVSLLYNSAECLVYPSFYEGFGLPVIEAMACGCPVVTSRTSSLPEVAGDAAILVDPYSVEDIARGIQDIINKPELRYQLIQDGFKQAQKYTWERTARETVSVFEQVFERV